MPIRKDDEVQVVRGHYKGQQVPRGIDWDDKFLDLHLSLPLFFLGGGGLQEHNVDTLLQ